MATQSHEADSLRQAAKTIPRYKAAWAAFPKKEDLTLDQDTAHPLLEIMADGKEVKCGSFMMNVSAGPRRFDTANCVVAKESFRDGQHYWEVSVGWKPRWNLGVISDLAVRQGRLIQEKSWWPGSGEVCPEGYWMISYNKKRAGKKYCVIDTNLMPIDCGTQPQTIGVYLNYPGREVTFFNADNSDDLTPLYSFYNADFKNAPVYPFFDTCYHDDGGNSQSLKIL